MDQEMYEVQVEEDAIEVVNQVEEVVEEVENAEEFIKQDEIIQQASNKYHITGEDNLLHESVVNALESTCYGIDKVVLQKLLTSKENHKHAQLSSLMCSNGKIHYLADYEDGNTLRVNIGDDSAGSEFDLVVVETVVALINNDQKNSRDLIEDDITLIDFTKNSHVKIGLHKNAPDDISIDSSYNENEIKKISWEGEIGTLLC